MDVFLANEQDLEVDETRLSILARHALEAEGLVEGAELSVLFVGADHIRQLNARFAGDDFATDVLAFPMMDEDDNSFLLGDVVICPSVAQTNARRINHGLAEELEVLLVHGLLHLLGYDHESVEDKEKMDARLTQIVADFHASVAG